MFFGFFRFVYIEKKESDEFFRFFLFLLVAFDGALFCGC